ncbi:MAG: hypothetical protein AAF493_03770 [Pseudomonadota bacterium]
MEPDVDWVEPEVGFELTPQTVTVETEHQREKLALCGLDPDTLGEVADASFFIRLGILAGVDSGITSEGSINMVQSLVQYRIIKLDEPLVVKGVIEAVTSVPRGKTVDTDVWFEDQLGNRVVSARRRSLKPDPSAPSRGAGERPPPAVDDLNALTSVGQFALTPPRVCGYSSEGNSIHYDMASAQRAGFRAPMIGGGMGVHYLIDALWKAHRPSAFDLDIFFRRPIFWDDAFDVGITADVDAMCLWRTEAAGRKVLTEARINKLTPSDS